MTAVTDEAIITVPDATVTGAQDTTIDIVGLSATLVDTVTDNGPEIISATISGVPKDTIFSAGNPTGFGTWVIPVADLPTLRITPPEFFAGTMNLTLTAFTIETSLSGPDAEVNVSLPFFVDIDPVADTFLIVANNVQLDTMDNPTDIGYSDLALRMTDARDEIEPGEIPNEYVEFNYTGLPTGVRLLPQGGGRLIDNGGGSYTFTGTPAQASQLFLVTGPGTVEKFFDLITVSGASIDGPAKLDPPITDTFRLWVGQDDTDSVSLTAPGDVVLGELNGGIGNDILTGDALGNIINGGDGSDLIIGGLGADTLSGGLGIDVFQWNPADITGGDIDEIIDFVPGVDILNFSPIFDDIGLAYDPQYFDISDFLVLIPDSPIVGDSTIQFAPAVAAVLGTPNLVYLSGVSGVTIQSLFDDGSILL